MKLADSSHERLEAFFREYLDDADFCLPAIDLHIGVFTKVFTDLISVHGITLGSRIFIKPTLLSLNRNNLPKLPEDLVAHEIAHVLQYKREGFIRFFYKYLTSYFGNLRKKKNWSGYSRHQSYLEIPFEIEARATAEKFTEWNNKRMRNEANLPV